MNHFDPDARALVDFGALEEFDFAIAVFLACFGRFDQALGQVENADFGDRIALALHGNHAVGLERQRAEHPLQTNRTADQVAVVLAADVNDFLSFDVHQRGVLQIDAERLVPDLDGASVRSRSACRRSTRR